MEEKKVLKVNEDITPLTSDEENSFKGGYGVVETDLIKLYIFSIKFTDCLDFDLSVLIKTSIFINYQNIRYHE